MTGSELVTIYEFSYGVLNRNLDGVSNEESLFIPQPAGNLYQLGPGARRYRSEPGPYSGWRRWCRQR